MGVLDDAIREHLDLKRRRGASDEEIARAEAEALGPARRPVDVQPDDDDDDLGGDPFEDRGVDESAATRMLRSPDEGDETSSPARSFPTRAVHDIDEDPLAPPAPVERAPFDDDDDDETKVRSADEPSEPPFDDDPAKPPPASHERDLEPPALRRPSTDEPIRWPPEDGPGGHDDD